MEQIISKENEHRVKIISRLYYGLYVYGRQNSDVDISDLEQAGRIAVYNISQKRAEMLDHAGYVSAAIKYACLGEIRKMRHKVRQVYLTHQHEEMIPIVDLLPTRERERGETAPEHLEQMDDLLYHIKHEFSPREADTLDSLVQGCRNVYDLNLSKPPTTETKDKVKVVTAMDLDDEEMIIYAQVLVGARIKFPHGYVSPTSGGRERAKKYFSTLLRILGTTTPEFAQGDFKKSMFTKYRLASFLQTVYEWDTFAFLKDLDPNLSRENVFRTRKWTGKKSLLNQRMIIEETVRKIKKAPKEIIKRDFKENGLYGMLCQIFGSSPRLAIEFVFPGTYLQYAERARELREKYTP